MKKITLFFFFLIMTIHPAWATETQFVFADIKIGQAILTANDNYFNRMSAAEIAIRSRSTTAHKTADDLKAQYAANVLDWTDPEKAQIRQLVADNREKLNKIAALLPAKVIFIKVTDQVEGGLPHTRANAIVLPLSEKPLNATLFYHELFHVLSRNLAARHDSLYDLIGFKPCDFTATAEIKGKMLTNPDVPAEGYYLPVTIEGTASTIMTFLHAAYPAFNPDVKGGFGGHFGFGLLKVKVNDGHCTVNPNQAGKAQILNPGTVPEFFAAIGQNTGYIIHPEEVLADNFVFVMTDNQDLPNPEIPARLGTWLGLK